MEEVLQQMLNEKGQPCLSLILTTFKLSPAREQNQEIIRKAISTGKALLRANQNWPAEILSILSDKLDELVYHLDYNHLMEGLGLFVSPHFSKSILFPFSVKEQIILGNSFETRDIGYLNQTMADFYILSLSKKEIHFFESTVDGLMEIRNDHFPVVFEDDYEYDRPVRGHSFGNVVKGFERDKSISQEMRQIAFLKTIDEELKPYLKEDQVCILNGVTEVISNFESITSHRSHIIGTITRNLSFTPSTLYDKGKTIFMEFKKQKRQKLINEIRESIGKNRAAIGLQEVWKNAWEGKGRSLVVEKDFYHRGYFLPGEEHLLHFSPPLGEYQIINDAVDDVIEKVLEKNGEVNFVDERELADMGRIALLLRYP